MTFSLTTVFMHSFIVAWHARAIAVYGNIRSMTIPLLKNKLLTNANSDTDSFYFLIMVRKKINGN
jgi:hypothetical protein